MPGFGIAGAAIATLISYLLLAIGASVAGAQTLKLHFPLLDLIKFSGCGLLMFFAVQQVALDSAWLELGLKVLVGMVVYAGLALLVDRGCRSMVRLAALRLKVIK